MIFMFTAPRVSLWYTMNAIAVFVGIIEVVAVFDSTIDAVAVFVGTIDAIAVFVGILDAVAVFDRTIDAVSVFVGTIDSFVTSKFISTGIDAVAVYESGLGFAAFAGSGTTGTVAAAVTAADVLHQERKTIRTTALKLVLIYYSNLY